MKGGEDVGEEADKLRAAVERMKKLQEAAKKAAEEAKKEKEAKGG